MISLLCDDKDEKNCQDYKPYECISSCALTVHTISDLLWARSITKEQIYLGKRAWPVKILAICPGVNECNRTRQNKTLSDNLHYATCQQSNFRLKIQTVAVLTPSV